ncbi:MAG: shikimate kinase [Cognaticolwellia sp.]
MQQPSQTFKRVVVFGNSASGKSSFAQRLAKEQQLAHLDLDSLAWLPISEHSPTPQRQDIAVSVGEIERFITQHNEWVIEGCYSDLLSYALEKCSEIIFLNLPIALCLHNAKNRPWEPHKYKTKAEQDGNLAMLLEWIAQYEKRTDTFSKSAHQKLYDEFAGEKTQFTHNQ